VSVFVVLVALMQFHTTPDKWRAPRLFHEPLEAVDSHLAPPLVQRVRVERVPADAAPESRVVSPNKAYWFRAACPAIDIFNERAYLVRVSLAEAECGLQVHARWINEKLLFVRVWWGRALGSDLIIDVEREKVLYHEAVNDGNLPFQQWKGR
jgi:hypothetical protein